MHQVGARVGTDRDEDALHVKRALLTRDGVNDADAAHKVSAVDVLDARVHDELNFLVGRGAVDHCGRGAKVLATVNEVNPVGEAGEKGGLLHSGVAAADHCHGFLPEEGAVAGRAP